MMVWKSFGASVIGPGHIASGKTNQDAWLAFHHVWGDGIVNSDGLGSKPYSNFGSRAACLAVAHAVNTHAVSVGIDEVEPGDGFLFERIKTNWLSLIAPLDPRDCAATCLFAFRRGDGILRLGMIGDGLGAVVKTDRSVVTMSDDKSEGFSNITAALAPNTSANDWQGLSLPEEECVAALLCTDGVADDLNDVNGFVTDFTKAYCTLATVSANRRLREMLINWPTPKHSDDKTIVCLCREETVDE